MPPIPALIRQLSSPDAYPHAVDDVEVHQTHISVVFLAGDYAYKIKKPVNFGFVDYSTLEKRRHFCHRELTLNRRLAQDVYLAVVPVVDGETLRMDPSADEAGEHRPVEEWAVQMRRLDEADTLRRRLSDDRVPTGLFARLGRRLAHFHDRAQSGPDVDACAEFDVVEKNALDNFRQSTSHVGHTVDPDVFDRLRAVTRQRLDEYQPLIAARAENHLARDTHGDLRLEHVYLFDDGDLRIVDCIEFNDAFRYADPVNDIAFLAMDLGFRGYDAESNRLLDAYFDARGDDEGRQLIDFYVAYRSCVRAKVQGIKAGESQVDADQRQKATERARAHWLYALSRLEKPGRGPALILIGGLPAAGKSTLGRTMVDGGDADVLLESDVVRKELADLDPLQSANADFGEGIYTAEFSERTYKELRRRAEAMLRKGSRVAVAATFVSDRRRRQMIEVARRLGVPVRFIECSIPDDVARHRLRARTDDASDADVDVYRELKERWESPSDEVARVHEMWDTSGADKMDE